MLQRKQVQQCSGRCKAARGLALKKVFHRRTYQCVASHVKLDNIESNGCVIKFKTTTSTMTKLLTKTKTRRCLPHQAPDEGTSDNVYFWLLVINVQLPEMSLWKTRHHLLPPSPCKAPWSFTTGPGFCWTVLDFQAFNSTFPICLQRKEQQKVPCTHLDVTVLLWLSPDLY